ncbi:hypothetical protein BGP_6000 [Beggiatoa sp. PS]|nr:hypothetical protein BGP_6000 [Beggiatoa sp. PS]
MLKKINLSKFLSCHRNKLHLQIIKRSLGEIEKRICQRHDFQNKFWTLARGEARKVESKIYFGKKKCTFNHIPTYFLFAIHYRCSEK